MCSSNVLAGQLQGVPVAGTLAHSFITSFLGTEVPPDPVSTSLPCGCAPESRPQSQSLPGRDGLAAALHRQVVSPAQLSPRAGDPVLRGGAGSPQPGVRRSSPCPMGCAAFTKPFPQTLAPAAGQGPRVDLAARAEAWLDRVCAHLGLGVREPHRGERAAFVAYALAFPRAFQGLLDTYSVQR